MTLDKHVKKWHNVNITKLGPADHEVNNSNNPDYINEYILEMYVQKFCEP